MLTLGQAAKLVGTSKTTLTRAIRAGRLSAIRRDDGGYQIDPAELSRVYTVTPATPSTSATTDGVVQQTTPADNPVTPTRDPAITALQAAHDAEMRLMRELLDEVRKRADEGKAREDELRAQLLLTDRRPPLASASPSIFRRAWRWLFGWRGPVDGVTMASPY